MVSGNSYLALTDRWDTYNQGPGGYAGGLGDTLALLVHEARHNQGKLHDCGSGSDSTFEQMGAWAVQSLYWYWIANHGNVNYLHAAANDVGSDYYLDDARNRAENTRASHICNDTRVLQTTAGVEFYNRGLDHYFLTASASEASGIDVGAAGANWSRTGKNFKVFPDGEHAPMMRRGETGSGMDLRRCGVLPAQALFRPLLPALRPERRRQHRLDRPHLAQLQQRRRRECGQSPLCQRPQRI